MSAPRIKVLFDVDPEFGEDCWLWNCKGCPPWDADAYGEGRTASAAADAGRVHLAAFHTAQMPVSTYCRTHGTHSAECGCGSGKSPAGDEGGAYNAAQRFEHTVACAADLIDCQCHDFPCCTTPMQHADHTREDA